MIEKFPIFWRRFFIVLTGTAMAQAIPFLTMPILTRMLPPSELGPYFVWIGVVTVLSVVLSLRLDVAIFNARTHQQLQELISAAVVCSILIAGTIYAILIGLDYFYSDFGNKLHLDFWRVEALVLGVVWAINMVVQNAYIYGAHFKRQAAVKVIQAGLVAAAQIGAVFMGWGVKGIIQLQIVATLTVLVWNVFDIYKKFELDLKATRVTKSWDALKENWRFPVFSMPADFISSFAGQMPVLMLGSRFGASPAGQYALTNKSLAAPMKLLAGSVFSVFKEEAARHYREKGECRDIFVKTLKLLALMGIVPFGVLYLFAEPIFSLLFGVEWKEAGIYASILAPMFYLQFVVSPLSYTLHLANKQLSDLIWQTALLLMTFFVFYSPGEFLIAIKLYAIGYSVLYVVYLWIAYCAACGEII
jgi:O-antigen/teichoic acid export membrane protein